ncbi:MAG: M48 family metalloprotease [Ferruginibacter sp.]
MKIAFTLFLSLFLLHASAQDIGYQYKDLSSVYYKSSMDSLKKAWACPATYTDKSTQKEFCNQWTSRTTYMQNSINDNDFVYLPEIFSYVDKIVTQLYQHNQTKFPKKPFLLIDRSTVANAYSIGENVIVVNIGLLTNVKYRDELALILAHEMSHNFLGHSLQSMKKKAEWLTSDEYKDFIKDLSKDKYNRYNKVVNAFKDYRFSSSKHNRFGESNADSMAVDILHAAGFAFDAAWFLRLDSVGLEYKTPLKKPIPDYFSGYGVTIQNAWLAKKAIGLSSRVGDADFNNPIEDSLKTHPDCKERYEALKSKTNHPEKAELLSDRIRVLADKNIIWNLYRNNNFTSAFYRLFLLQDEGVKDGWTDFMMSNLLLSFYAEDAMLNRSNVIRVKPKAWIGKDYFAMQTMLEQVPSASITEWEKAAKAIKTEKLGKDETVFRNVLKSVAINPEEYKYARKKERASFLAPVENTIYAEYFY